MKNLKDLLNVKDLASLSSEELEVYLNSTCAEDREDARHYRNNAVSNEVIEQLFKTHQLELSDTVEIGMMMIVKIMLGCASEGASLPVLYAAVLGRMEDMIQGNIDQVGDKNRMFSVRSRRGLN